jgi:hypothetical protein
MDVRKKEGAAANRETKGRQQCHSRERGNDRKRDRERQRKRQRETETETEKETERESSFAHRLSRHFSVSAERELYDGLHALVGDLQSMWL